MLTRRFAFAGVLAVVLMSSSWLLGDDPPKSAPKARGTLPQGWTKLGLSDEQKSQAYAIIAEYRGKIDDLQRQINQLRKQERGELMKVLTDAQREHLREVIASKVGGDEGASKDEKKAASTKTKDKDDNKDKK